MSSIIHGMPLLHNSHHGILYLLLRIPRCLHNESQHSQAKKSLGLTSTRQLYAQTP